LKQLELTGVCAPFEKNTSEKRKPCKCTYGAAKRTNSAMHGVAYIADITTAKNERKVITALEEKITYWNALLKLLYP
jgi:hypothetical protein